MTRSRSPAPTHGTGRADAADRPALRRLWDPPPAGKAGAGDTRVRVTALRLQALCPRHLSFYVVHVRGPLRTGHRTETASHTELRPGAVGVGTDCVPKWCFFLLATGAPCDRFHARSRNCTGLNECDPLTSLLRTHVPPAGGDRKSTTCTRVFPCVCEGPGSKAEHTFRRNRLTHASEGRSVSHA